jgi:hypothetical protein
VKVILGINVVAAKFNAGSISFSLKKVGETGHSEILANLWAEFVCPSFLAIFSNQKILPPFNLADTI